jgi:hypothetical protein
MLLLIFDLFQGANFDARYPFFILGKPRFANLLIFQLIYLNLKFSAGMTLTGVLSSLFLPETLHQNLPNTIREAESFGINQSFWHLPKKLKNVTE